MTKQPLRDRIAFALFVYDYDEDRVPGEAPGDLPYLSEIWSQWLATLDQPHCGDCTSIPMTCTRCLVENYYALADRLIAFWECLHQEEQL